MKTKGAAIILALLLGGLGIHWFYLGKSGKGVMYLLFSWTGIPSILAFFTVIGLLFMSQEVFDETYNY